MKSYSSLSVRKANYGRLWRRSHESFTPDVRRILSVAGTGATTFLQGLVTSDLLNAPSQPREELEISDGLGDSGAGGPNSCPSVGLSGLVRATCFLDSKGRIVTDSLLWKTDEHQYYIDVPAATADGLLKHLKQFQLRRSRVNIDDSTSSISSHVIFGTLQSHGCPPGCFVAMDPRHPSLGMRVLVVRGGEKQHTQVLNSSFADLLNDQFPQAPGTYDFVRKLAGVAEGIEVVNKLALETNQEFLNAISFRKGCYLGQELTARTHHTGAIRKRVMPLLLMDTQLQIPEPWLLSSLNQRWHRVQYQQVTSKRRKDFEEHSSVEEIAELQLKLPRISVATAGSMISMIAGSLEKNWAVSDVSETSTRDELERPSPMASVHFFERMKKLRRGDKIIDSKDGRTIGQLVAEPEEGTNVVLAQMRLDAVGLVGDESWTHQNSIAVIGDGEQFACKERVNSFRYLPYLPLWWPRIDPSTGKGLN